jgi:hypothetical protein
MKSVLKTAAVLIVASSVLTGCAVYGPPPAYPDTVYRPAPAYVQPAPGYYQPAPVYVQPAPVYVQPPVTFGFNFGWWGGGGRHWHR